MKANLFIKQLGEYFDVFLPGVRKLSENTISAYADAFAIFFEFLYEQKKLPHHLVNYKHFTATLIDDYLLWLRQEKGYADTSVHQRLSAVRAFLKYASRREMAALNAYSITSTAEHPTIKANPFPYFTCEEMKVLLSLPRRDKYLGSRDIVLLPVLYDTAARAQELCDLCVGDIRFGSPTKVRLLGKGGKAREVPISDEVTTLLRYYLKEHDLDTKEKRSRPLFSSQTNERMTVACVRSIVAKYVSLAKTSYPDMFYEPKYSPHSFRHSKAVHMVESGVNIIYIRNFLGHAFVSSTEIYAQVSQEAVAKALANRKIPQLAASPPAKENSKYTVPEFIAKAR
jgi:site-specific recombinase XerD